jgi:pyruvate,water dikinase
MKTGPSLMDRKKKGGVKMSYEASPFEFDEELDLAQHAAWFIDGMHVPDGADYVGGSWVADVVQHGFTWAAELFSLPACKGILWRDYKHLRFIVTPHVVESEAEIKEREVKFKRNMVQLVKDFGPMWEKYKAELIELYRPFKEFNRKGATAWELARKIEDLRQVGYRMCEIHFWGMYAAFSFFMIFRELCKNLGVDTASTEFSGLLRGFDNKSFECERELWHLSRKAIDLGLAPMFDAPAAEVAPALQKNEKGTEWLKELDVFLNEYGWRCERCWFPSTPSWIEDPRYSIRKVQDYLKLEVREPYRQKAAEAREAAVAKVQGQIPEEMRELFNTFLKGAQYADMFSEEHDLYCEMQTDALRRVYCIELGKRFQGAGTIDDPQDIFYLWLDESRKISAWPEKWRLQSLMAERKAKAKADLEKGIPPIISKNLTDMEAFGYMVKSRDPILIQVIVGELPEPKPELKADIIGVPGAPGVGEGPARIVFTDDQIGEVLPGEILVCPTTTIAWTTAFALVKGVVVDRGGILSHAAVVSREFGLPCVLNTFVGTEKIKTGQRIRVDGTQGAIYILE